MPVVAGHRAEEADGSPRPGAGAAGDAAEQRVDDRVVHEGEAGVAERQQLLGRDPEQLGEDLGEFAETEAPP